MTPRSLEDSRLWVRQGTKLVADAVAGLGDDELGRPSRLPGWTRKHVLAHLAANADAIGNLVHWAATGQRTPMYSSPDQRDGDIESGSAVPGRELVEWQERAAAALDIAMDSLSEAQWGSPVVTAQGRTVPATETPWMRAREVMVHAVDLRSAVTFDDLPADFLASLVGDIVTRRSASAAGPTLTVLATDTGAHWDVAGSGAPVPVTGTLAALTSYLSGRGPEDATTPDGSTVPVLPAWL